MDGEEECRLRMLGFESWYGWRVVQERRGWYLDEHRRREHKYVAVRQRALHPQMYLLNESERCQQLYFRKGEEIPCRLRGSLAVMVARGRSRRVSMEHVSIDQEVLLRYLRKIKFTCVSTEDVHAWLDRGGKQLIWRIRDTWSARPSHANTFDAIQDVLFKSGVFLNGEPIMNLSHERLEVLRKLHQQVRKLERV